MVPRIHDRGSSFKEAVNYILHDPKSQTADRLAWTHTENLGGLGPAEAWRPMYETWNNRTALKIAAGVDLRGRDNTNPVFHYTLSWHPGEQPSREHMIETALSSLKALKLEAHQTLMAAHKDTEHPHVHIIVNTVHPETGRTAPLKHTRLELSRWAEEYERAHGIQCEQRIENNAKRALAKEERKAYRQPTPEVTSTFVPKHLRPDWIEKRDVINRMKRLRAEVEHRHLVYRDVTSSHHRQERQEVLRESESAVSVALAYVQDRFKSRWQDLYEAQRLEFAHLSRIQDKPLERAVFVIANSERLGNGAPLSMKAKAALIQSPTKLFEAVERVHMRERRALSNVQRVEVKARLDKVWQAHQQRMDGLITRQAAERTENRAIQDNVANHSLDYMLARIQLKSEKAGRTPVRTAARAAPNENDVEYVYRIKDETRAFYERNAGPEGLERMRANEPQHPAPAVDFNEAAKKPLEPLSRADQIARDMAEWKAKHANKDMDFDRER